MFCAQRSHNFFHTSQFFKRNQIFNRNYSNNAHSNKVGIGIDLGTTNSCIAIVEDNQARVLENEEGYRTTPSVLTITNENEFIVGRNAKNQIVVNPKNTFYATKRLIGRKFNDPIISVIQNNVNYDIIPKDGKEDGDAFVYSHVNQRAYSPSEIGSYVVKKMKKIAEDFLNSPVTSAVITVPAYFNDAQRQATKDAGKLAGLDVKRIINEPTAAALAYGIQTNENKTISVFDLGGGTFDISILSIDEGIFEVRSTNGDTFLGGDDFDLKITNYIADSFYEQHKINLKEIPEAMQRIRGISESIKIDLTHAESVDVSLPYIVDNLHLSMKITREKYDQLTADLLKRLLDPCEKCVRDANISLSKISEVILVGGMTRDGKIAEVVENFFGKKPFLGLNPDESIAIGAAFHSAILMGKIEDFLLLDVNPLSLGIEMHGGLFERLIKRNSPIPTEVAQVFTTGVDWQTEVDIKIFQGEREMVEDNKFLGQLLLPVKPSVKGVPQIKVTFKIDANGIVQVITTDLLTQTTKEIEIQAAGSLNKDEIERILQESEKCAQLDLLKKEKAKAKLAAENAISDCKKTIEKYRKHLTENDISTVMNVVSNVEKEIENVESNSESIRSQITLLQNVQLEVFQNAIKNKS